MEDEDSTVLLAYALFLRAYNTVVAQMGNKKRIIVDGQIGNWRTFCFH